MKKGAMAIETLVALGIAAVVLIVVLILFMSGVIKSGGTISFLQENTTAPFIPKIGEEIGKITEKVVISIR